MDFVNHPLMRGGTVEARTYQLNLAKACLSENTLIVLPTGLGKTAIALLAVAEFLRLSPEKRCMMMAPTRILVHQHYKFFLERLSMEGNEMAFITGEEQREKRSHKWMKKVVFATPQVVKSDSRKGGLNLQDYSLLIFDEVHRAVGDYPYVEIARTFTRLNKDGRIVGMTASLPSERTKVREMMEALRISRTEVRDEGSGDVMDYVPGTEMEWVELRLPPVMEEVVKRMRAALRRKVELLRAQGLIEKQKPEVSTRDLLLLRERIWEIPSYSGKQALLSALRLNHCVSLLETQSLSSFVRFFERALRNRRSLATRDLSKDSEVMEAYEIARGALHLGIEHPKLGRLKEILGTLDGSQKAIVFASYRDSVETIRRVLASAALKVKSLVGKAGKEGQSQDEQLSVLEEFRKGSFNILVATQVGEEGIDVSECNLVFFYDNVPSAIRFVQRRGRTGRRTPGKVFILMVKGTRDEAQYWVGERKMKALKRMTKMMARKGEEASLDEFIRPLA